MSYVLESITLMQNKSETPSYFKILDVTKKWHHYGIIWHYGSLMYIRVASIMAISAFLKNKPYTSQLATVIITSV